MCQAGTVEIVFAGLEYLRLRLEASEGVGEDDAVALDLKGIAIVGLGNGSFRKAFEVEVVIESVLHAILACLPKLVSLQSCFTSIMKYPKPSFVFGLICAVMAFAALSSTVEARIGESKSILEKRLLASGGLVYRDEAIIEARRRGMPYEGLFDYVVSDIDVQVYHKSASKGKKALRSKFSAKRMLPGWDLHVVYVNGRSVLEIYQRSPKMTEQEQNLLLHMQGQGSRWSRVEKGQQEVGGDVPDSAREKKELSVFGYEMIRNDKAVRAKLVKNGILFVDAEMDAKFAIARDDDRNSSAPESVSGF